VGSGKRLTVFQKGGRRMTLQKDIENLSSERRTQLIDALADTYLETIHNVLSDGTRQAKLTEKEHLKIMLYIGESLRDFAINRRRELDAS
tara:strand:+ start:1189 stop:1458 length:270 start_codon:yes stop_codon:yes gene_type:complete